MPEPRSRKLAATRPDIRLQPTLSVYAQESLLKRENSICVPASRPRPIIDKLHAALVQSLADSHLRAGFEQLGFIPMSSTGDEVSKRIEAESRLWRAGSAVHAERKLTAYRHGNGSSLSVRPIPGVDSGAAGRLGLGCFRMASSCSASRPSCGGRPTNSTSASM